MGSLGNLNSDEFDTIIELIICVLFMAFGAWCMSRMVMNLSERIDVLEYTDKVEVTNSTHNAEDPFYFTGYQAYMFAYHMDSLSYEDLYWVGGKVNASDPPKIDGSDRNHVRIGALDNDGNVMRQFYTWRNQMITGAGAGVERNVKDTINSVGVSDLKSLYRGKSTMYDGGKNYPIMFHLELTDNYSNSKDLGDDLNTGGKTFKWILAPKLKK